MVAKRSSLAIDPVVIGSINWLSSAEMHRPVTGWPDALNLRNVTGRATRHASIEAKASECRISRQSSEPGEQDSSIKIAGVNASILANVAGPGEVPYTLLAKAPCPGASSPQVR
jgi:hypothetical protein